MKKRCLLIALALATGLCGSLFSAEIELKQQFSAWFSLNNDQPSTPLFGLRYQPTLSLAQTLGRQWKLDSELSLDLYASGSAPAWKSPDIDAEQFYYQDSTSVFGAGGNAISFSALLARYPLGLLDSLGTVVYLDWRHAAQANRCTGDDAG